MGKKEKFIEKWATFIIFQKEELKVAMYSELDEVIKEEIEIALSKAVITAIEKFNSQRE